MGLSVNNRSNIDQLFVLHELRDDLMFNADTLFEETNQINFVAGMRCLI
jgi:hypothetical protein